MAATQESANTNCRILELPAELGNRIYRYAIVDTCDIKIKSKEQPPPPPGLLQAFRSIRAEAIDIYYQENEFTFEIDNLDASTYIGWCRQPNHKHQAKNFVMFTTDSMHWGNLMRWLEACFNCECKGPVRDAHNGVNLGDAVPQLFALAQRLGGCGLGWKQVQGSLEMVRQTRSTQNELWDNGCSA